MSALTFQSLGRQNGLGKILVLATDDMLHFHALALELLHEFAQLRVAPVRYRLAIDNLAQALLQAGNKFAH